MFSNYFAMKFIGKNYFAWEFQFRLFVMGKELWGHIDRSDPAPTDVHKLPQWQIKDARGDDMDFRISGYSYCS